MCYRKYDRQLAVQRIKKPTVRIISRFWVTDRIIFLEHSSTSDWLEVRKSVLNQHRHTVSERQRSCVKVMTADITKVSINITVSWSVSYIVVTLVKKVADHMRAEPWTADPCRTRISCDLLHLYRQLCCIRNETSNFSNEMCNSTALIQGSVAKQYNQVRQKFKSVNES